MNLRLHSCPASSILFCSTPVSHRPQGTFILCSNLSKVILVLMGKCGEELPNSLREVGNQHVRSKCSSLHIPSLMRKRVSRCLIHLPDLERRHPSSILQTRVSGVSAHGPRVTSAEKELNPDFRDSLLNLWCHGNAVSGVHSLLESL